MKCAYCGVDCKPTREHIISKSVLDLFPECNFTFDYKRKKVYPAEPMTKDVCADCNNNKLSYIDSYAKDFIETYCIQTYKKDIELSITFDYIMIEKVLLKYTFNSLRSINGDTSLFDHSIINYLLDKKIHTHNKLISIFSGIHVNTSIMPEVLFENKKLQIREPIFLSNSMIEYFDEFTGQVYRNKNIEKQNFNGILLSRFFRFNSFLFIIIIWDSIENKELGDKLIPLMYPYQEISHNAPTTIKRCTHAYNCHKPDIIETNWGMTIADSTNSLIPTNKDPIEVQKEVLKSWNNKTIK